MFGNKDDKNKRLEQIVEMVAKAPVGLTQAALARLLGVARSTISKDILTLEKRGVRLSEDRRGRIRRSD